MSTTTSKPMGDDASIDPTHGDVNTSTPMQGTEPSSPEDIARVTLASRLLMPETPLLLGCARPAGMHKIETDIWAIKAGVDGIAFPSEDACEFAEELGLDIKFHQECCSLLWQEAQR